MMTEAYDSEDTRNASPPLVEQKINYAVRESPPPFVHEKSESPGGKHSPRGGSRKRPRQCEIKANKIRDALIIRNLVDDPVLSQELAENPLTVHSPSDPDCSDKESMEESPKKEKDIGRRGAEQTALPDTQHTSQQLTAQLAAQQAAQTALGMLPDDGRRNPQVIYHVKAEPGGDEESQQVGGSGWEGHQVRKYSQPSAYSPLKGKDGVGEPLNMIKPLKPELQLHSISEIYGDRSTNLTLPALQPPSQSASAKSPEGSQSLPSLKSTLPEQLS